MKAFFSSLWTDIKELLKKHFFKFLGFIISFIVPVSVLLTEYTTKVNDASKFAIPFGVIIPLSILLIIYWCKLRRYLATKIQLLKQENNLEKGKHAGLIIASEVLNVAMTILPFGLVYLLAKKLEEYAITFSEMILFILICQLVGGLFIIIDTIKNVAKDTGEEKDESEGKS